MCDMPRAPHGMAENTSQVITDEIERRGTSQKIVMTCLSPFCCLSAPLDHNFDIGFSFFLPLVLPPIDAMQTCRLEMLDELKSMGMQTLQLDVTSQESISAAVELIEEADGRIDVLVCNAGQGPFPYVVENGQS